MTTRTKDGAAITIHDSFLTSMDTQASRAALPADYCSTCHKVGGVAPSFGKLHNSGFNPKIYSTSGDRYSEKIVVTAPTATIANKVLTITFTAKGIVGTLDAKNITPTVLVGLYGYDSKDFLVAAHGTNADGKRNLEYIWGSTATTNPTTRFTEVSKTTDAGTGVTTWVLTANLSAWATQIDAKKIKRAEIAVMPSLLSGTTVLGLNAPSKTFNLDGVTNDSAYFKDIVNVLKTAGTGAAGTSAAQVNGCNSCHDQLATTFHSGTRGGNIKVCRICHEVSNAGSHLELQSRSIDSYIHSIHSFQAFDPGDLDFDDPVVRMEYAEHIASTFPRFTIQNCESCHVAAMYSVPDQSKSMPGVLSGSDAVAGRNIGAIPAAVTGPAVRACGGCHRAQVINADDAGKLQVLISHWQTNGMYIYVTETAAVLWAAVVEKIMGFFG
jgi:OmcA/MtrC family decaheme c-type cytochrome